MNGMNLVILSSARWCSVFIRENLSGVETREIAGLKVLSGKLNGQPVTLYEIEDDGFSLNEENLLAGLPTKTVISLGEAYSCKKNLAPGDMVISSAASFLDRQNSGQLEDIRAELKLVDLALKATEKFIDEGQCKVIVGKVFLNPGTARTGRRLTFLPRNDIYCIDRNGYPLTQWVIDGATPFVLVRTVIPAAWTQNRELAETRFKWEMAKRNFWIVRGLADGLKKRIVQEKVRKVDLI